MTRMGAAATADTFSSRSSTCSPPAAVSNIKQHGAVTCASGYNRESRCRTSGPRWSILLYLALVALLFCPPSSASSAHVDLVNHFQRNMEPLIYDQTSPPPIAAERLHARQNDDGQSGRGSKRPNNNTIATASPPVKVSLPRAFDTSLGNNFTSRTCPAFFNSFLFDPQFRDCVPVSLLLQTSNAFFQATRSGASRLDHILSASCAVDFQACSTLMTRLASDISSSGNCGQDLGLQNPMVIQAYSGLSAYEPVYRAACLQDPTETTSPSSHARPGATTNATNSTVAIASNSTRTYCFTNAITNSSSPASGYIYYLPLGNPLPADSKPACTQCLQQTMAILQAHPVPDSNPSPSNPGGSQDLHRIYTDAATAIDSGCGPGFARALSSAAPPSLHPLLFSPSSSSPSSGLLLSAMYLGCMMLFLFS